MPSYEIVALRVETEKNDSAFIYTV